MIAPAPYAAPAAYYFPTAARMSGIELRKGSASIKHGPYTTGGALNMLSTPIPYARGGRVEIDAGSHAMQNLHAHFGGSGDTVGFLVETVQQRTDGFKDLDGGGDTGYTLSDYLVKLRWMPLVDHSFELKLGATEQAGDETYLGLTATDFAATPFRRYAASQRDNIETSHRQYQLRHEWAIGPDSDLTTVVYNNDFSRAWYKLQSVGGAGLSGVLRNPGAFADEYTWLTGSDSPDDALVIRNNDRSYFSRGIQSVFGLGARGSQDNRVARADAVAVFIQDEIRAGAWTITPGIRHERIDGARYDYARTDPTRAAGPTRVRRSSESVTIPGLGVNRELGNGLFAFASAHRGFTPPAPGSTSRAEESVNYEYGIRYGGGALYGEAIGFYNDYSNLVGTCTASTGGGCEIGDQFDGGAVSMSGLEFSLGYGVTAGAVRLPLSLSYTMTRARFDTAFDSGFGEWGSVQRGDELPYLPEHQLRIGAGIEAAAWQVHLGAAWVDEMRTTAGRGTPVRTDRTDSYLVLDVAAGWTIRDGLTLVGKVDNLLDDEHIVAWRPAGARPGKPRSVTVGIRYDF
ncbi:MAG: TonB-dependent receptor [Xanthomonadaceae bacterium]|nr:TonB-dependent receptor [Xanthomonadaceae bacterium]